MPTKSAKGGTTPATTKPKVAARSYAPGTARLSAPEISAEIKVAVAPSAQGHRLPERFSFSARGASIEVVDAESGRRVSFPKAATGIVANVLGGLFASDKTVSSGDPWIAAFPDVHENAELGLLLKRTRVAVDSSHPNRVLGRPKGHPEGLVLDAYPIMVDGKKLGYLVAHAAHRFMVVSPELQERITAHKGFEAAALRIEVLVRGFKERQAPEARPALSA